MRLLVCAQAVDERDAVLGFFVGWLREISSRYESLHVIALGAGAHSLPENVRVHSLGKERGRAGKIRYALRFLSLTWRLRREYDAVFVHMNQEYVLLGGIVWKMFGKKVYLWRNHYEGSVLTDVAALFCRKVFCTSKFSYTAKYRKTAIMPVGVDTTRFSPVPGIARIPHTILFLARIAPSKRIEMLVDAVSALSKEGVQCSVSVFGSPLPEHRAYYTSIEDRIRKARLENIIRCFDAIPNRDTPAVYSAHGIFVNTSASGMYDKTLFEAAACGCVVLASSRDFSELSGEPSFETSEELTALLKTTLSLPESSRESKRMHFRDVAKTHSLERLAERLAEEMGA